MAVNPCCCDIKTGCIVMVSTFLVSHVMLFILHCASLGMGYDIMANIGVPSPRMFTAFSRLLMQINTAVDIILVVVCIVVLIGAIKEIVGLIWVWYGHIIYLLNNSIQSFLTMEQLYISIPICLVNILITCYFLWVGQAFINKIKADKRNPRPNAQGFNQLQPMQYGYPPPGQSPSAQYQQQGQQPPPMYGSGGQQPKMYGPGGQQPPMYGHGGQQLPMGTDGQDQ